MQQQWTKAFPCLPRDNLVSHVNIKQKIFTPSYERDGSPPQMSFLLGWEYGRIWLKERDEFLKQQVKQSKPKQIKNNYEEWLKKRQVKSTKKA